LADDLSGVCNGIISIFGVVKTPSYQSCEFLKIKNILRKMKSEDRQRILNRKIFGLSVPAKDPITYASKI